MYKTARIFITLLIAALLLPACTRKQAPTPSDRGNSMGGNGNSPLIDANYNGLGDFIPDGGGTDGFGLPDDFDGGLVERGAGDGMANGKYGDWDMVEGILMPVYFGFDSSSISASERSKLQEAADYLNQNPENALLIEGHCDWHGTAEYNIALGERRANSAMDYLLTLGISPSRVETLSKGSLEATTGLEKDDSIKDRRADLIVLK